MEVIFANRKLQKACSSKRELAKAYGANQAKRIMQRLQLMQAVDNLAELHTFAVSCHELKSDRVGQLAVNLGQPYRLVFEPANDPVPRKADGGLDWTGVTKIRILEVVDYHG